MTDAVLAACDRVHAEAGLLARAVAKARALGPLERRLERRVAHAFDVQGKSFLRRFAALRPRFPEVREAISNEDWEPLLDSAFRATQRLLDRAIQDAAEAAVHAGATSTLTYVGSKLAFTLENPRAVDYLTDYGAARVTMIEDTTREQLRALIAEGVEQGWGYDRIAGAITQRYAEFRVGTPQQHVRSRAHLIAITETGEAYEQGNLMAAEDLEADGTPMEKSWLTVGDDRVSDGCQHNQAAGWIGLGKAFPSGHQRPLRFPGCRCALLTRAKEAA